LSQVVEVNSEAPLLKTERADVAVTFNEKTVTNVPLINRHFTQLELLAPGGQANTSQTATTEDIPRADRKVGNGRSVTGTTHLLDGTDNRDALVSLIVINPTLESLSEAKITTAAYDAEFGATAGVISVQTKSGTNDFHAVAFEFLRND